MGVSIKRSLERFLVAGALTVGALGAVTPGEARGGGGGHGGGALLGGGGFHGGGGGFHGGGLGFSRGSGSGSGFHGGGGGYQAHDFGGLRRVVPPPNHGLRGVYGNYGGYGLYGINNDCLYLHPEPAYCQNNPY
jgi:hypothetical protein